VNSRHLRIVVCAAGPAGDVPRLIEAAHERSWTTEVIATSNARDFIDIPTVERLTDNPVRSTYQITENGHRVLPAVDALIVAPATYNTMNKLALGIADTYVLSSAAELIGRNVPTVVVPFVNAALGSRAPFSRAVAALRAEGVRVLCGPEDEWQPHAPGTGAEQQARFPWRAAFQIAAEMTERHTHPAPPDEPAQGTHTVATEPADGLAGPLHRPRTEAEPHD
jgi:phosphopantothenoylcysteine synthetase/decarboxylase